MSKIIYILIIFISTASFANQKIPSGADIGLMSTQLREKAMADKKTVKLPESRSSEQQNIPEQSKKINVTLSKIVIQGAETYSDEELKKLYSHLLHKKIKLSKIYELANKITTKYQEDGYILSFAVIPEQKIKNNTIIVQVIEGYLDKITFSGKLAGDDFFYNSWREELKKTKPINKKTLERVLMIANNMPGVEIDNILSSSESFAASELEVNFKQKHINTHITANNFASQYSGFWQQMTNISSNSMLGIYEKISIKEMTSMNVNYLKLFDISSNIPINSNGTQLNIGYSIIKNEPKSLSQNVLIEGASENVTFGIEHPVIMSNKINLGVAANLNILKNRNDIERQIISDEKLPILNLSTHLNVEDRHSNGRSSIGLSITKGLNIFEASRKGDANLSRDGGNPQFLKLDLSLQRKQPIFQNSNLIFQMNGQFSKDSLLSSQESSYGGAVRYGKGYESSALVSDNSINASVEFNYILGSAPELGLKMSQIYGLIDGVYAWKKEKPAEGKRYRTLYSGSIGMRTFFENDIFLNSEIAFPLKSGTNFSNDKIEEKTRMYFSFNLNL